jgi:hypothetical protein
VLNNEKKRNIDEKGKQTATGNPGFKPPPLAFTIGYATTTTYKSIFLN